MRKNNKGKEMNTPSKTFKSDELLLRKIVDFKFAIYMSLDFYSSKYTKQVQT